MFKAAVARRWCVPSFLVGFQRGSGRTAGVESDRYCLNSHSGLECRTRVHLLRCRACSSSDYIHLGRACSSSISPCCSYLGRFFDEVVEKLRQILCHVDDLRHYRRQDKTRQTQWHWGSSKLLHLLLLLLLLVVVVAGRNAGDTVAATSRAGTVAELVTAQVRILKF